MESLRSHKVKLDALGRREFCVILSFTVGIIALSCVIGTYGPPPTLTSPVIQDINLLNASCTVDVTGQKGTVVPRCWQHWFEFHQAWTQSFRWQVQFQPAASRPAVSQTVQFRVLWQGSSSLLDTVGGWGVIANSTIFRTVTCAAGAPLCDPVTIFLTDVVAYKSYFFQVALTPQSSNFTLASSSSFSFEYGNAEFAQFELGFRLSFLALTVFVSAVYLCSMSGLTQRGPVKGAVWMKALLATLFLFNNPLFFLDFLTPSALLIFFGSLFQITFICVLLLFFLAEFGLLASADPHALAGSRSFWLPRVALLASYWLVALTLYSWVSFKQHEDPLYDWSLEPKAQAGARVVAIVMPCVYLCVLGHHVLGAGVALFRASVGKGQPRPSLSSHWFLYTSHLATVGIALGGVGFGVLYNVNSREALDYLFFNAVFNVCVWTLAYLYSPLPDVPVEEGRVDDGVLVTEAGDNVTVAFQHPHTLGPRITVPGGTVGSPARDAFGIGSDDEDDDLPIHAHKQALISPHPSKLEVSGVVDLTKSSPRRRVRPKPPSPLVVPQRVDEDARGLIQPEGEEGEGAEGVRVEVAVHSPRSPHSP